MEGQNLQIKGLINRNFKSILLYFVLILAGIFNIAGLFGNLANIMTGPAIIAISLWLLWELISSLDFFNNKKIFKEGVYKRKFRTTVIFSLTIIIGGWLIELLTVKSGFIFGHLTFTDKLLPQLSGVPLALGFAWFTSFLASAAFVENIPNIRFVVRSKFGRSLLVGFFMMSLDFVLEPAANNLGYWTWLYGVVPFWNYLSWWAIGTLISYLAIKFEMITSTLPKLAFHAYPALLIYLIISYFKI